MKPLPLFFITLVVAATISIIPVSHCRIMQQKDTTNLVEKTCKQTPHHDLCVQYLQSDPQSSKEDVTGLALIMVNTMKTKANNALDKIHHLLQRNSEPALKEALNSCAGRYRAIVEADVAQAVAGLQKGDPKFAENGANDAAIEASSCEKSFEGKKSPLTNDNNVMHDVADITAAIVRLLL